MSIQLKCCNAVLGYEKSVVSENINFTVNSGDYLCILGENGAGKSTFAALLAKFLGGKYIPEPAEGTNPYLDDYYKDPARYAFNMQMFLLTKRYRAQKKAQSAIKCDQGGFYVMDRSYYGDVCFAVVQKEKRYFDDRDYQTYLAHHADMKEELDVPQVAIFLDVTPETSNERIKKRARNCEAGVPIDYLNSLNIEINKLAENMSKITNVFRIDWNKDLLPYDIEQVARQMAEKIKNIEQSVYDSWTGIAGIGV